MTGISILPKSPLGIKDDFYQSDFGKFFGCCCFNGKLMLVSLSALGIWAGTIENLIVFSCLSFHSTPF
jgi:hypothetical protein